MQNSQRSCVGMIALVMFATLSLPFVRIVQGQSQPAVQGTVLQNADVQALLAAGLGTEVVIAKIKASATRFDTSPNALTTLKAQGVPDPVLTAMIMAGTDTSRDVSAPTPVAPASGAVPMTMLEYTPHHATDKGARKMVDQANGRLDSLANGLKEALPSKGIIVVTQLDGRSCCITRMAILRAGLQDATFMGQTRRYLVTAKIDVRDAMGQVRYSREFEGVEAKRIGPFGTRTPGPSGAIRDLVEKILDDAVLLHHLKRDH